MFPAAKAQFDLAMAWSELALSTLAAGSMIASCGAKVVTASAALDISLSPGPNSSDSFLDPWSFLSPQQGAADTMRFALAATQATTAFWSTLLEPVKRQAKPSLLWWTTFADPLTASSPAAPAPRDYLLH